MTDDEEHDNLVRKRAYRIWLEEGRPEGRAAAHWDMASELVAIEESQKDTLLPNPTVEYENNPTTEPIEPILAVENAGEFPTLTDEGEEATYPSRDNLPSEPPVKAARKPAAPRKKRKAPT